MSEEYIRRLSVIVRLNKWKSDIADIYGKNDEYVKCIEDVISIVDSIPKVETEPVRHSCVKDNGCCLICDSPIPTDAGLDHIARNEVRYCYFCGAKMDGKENKK